MRGQHTFAFMAKGVEKNKRSVASLMLRVLLILFISSTLYTILCRWVMPPITLTQLGGIVNGYGLKRDYVSWREIPASVKLAAIASEDQLFPSHNGFDWRSMERSMNQKTGKKGNKRKHKIWGGGASTISQQTAKNVFLWQGSGWGKYIRKLPEFYFTQMIEWTWGKKRILEVYLNVIEMGPGIFGIEAAAQQYFHKHARDLTQTEAAMIISCLPNPVKFTVKPVSRRVQWRYPQVLAQMSALSSHEDVHKLAFSR